MSTERKVLPADVYDTLEFASLAFGGIGAGPYLENYNPDCPVCAHGLLFAATGEPAEVAVVRGCLNLKSFDERLAPLGHFLSDIGVHGLTNDFAVSRINARKNVDRWDRVSFKEWCAELNIVRGDS